MLSKTFNFPHNTFKLFDFFKKEKNLFFLDSSLSQGGNGQYSFIGFDPFHIAQGDTLESYTDFKKKYLQFKLPRSDGVSPLSSGVVGYLSYDLGLIFQGVSSQKSVSYGTPLFHFGFYDVIVTIDHFNQELYVTSSGLPELNPSLRLLRAQQRLKQVCKRLRPSMSASGPLLPLSSRRLSEC